MESHLLPYRSSVIHYLKMGKGDRYLCCFHGYGEDASSFQVLEQVLGNDYTLLCIDFPFHGSTEWREGTLFTDEDLLAILGSILPLDWQSVSLLGYSMGGRVAMHLLQRIPHQIDRVVLIAPDGLHKNFWYWLATQTRLGNRLFRYTANHPKWFFSIMRWMRNARLLNKSAFKFAHAYLDDAGERESLYLRWTTMRRFIPSAKKITAALRRYPVPVRMLFGSYDRIILASRSKRLAADNECITVRKMKAGHQLLKDKYAKDIAALFFT